MFRSLISSVLVLAIAVPAASAQTAGAGDSSANAPAAAPAADACPVTVPANTGEWKRVEGTGITFCVPRDWRVANTRATYPGGTVRWQYSLRRGEAFVIGGSRGPGTIANTGSGSAGTAIARRVSNDEVIGGEMGNIWFEEGNGRVATGVTFTEARVSFTGEASGKQNVDLQLAVYRTIRFVR